MLKTGTREWSDYSVNCIYGCGHDVGTANAKSMAARFHRIRPENWKHERIKPSAIGMRFRKKRGDDHVPHD